MVVKNQKNPISIFVLFIFIVLLYGFGLSTFQKTLLERGKYLMETEGNLEAAISVFDEIIKKFPADRVVAAQAQFYIGLCFERMGRDEAKRAYQKVIDNYPGSGDIMKAARQRLLDLGPIPPMKPEQIILPQQEFSKAKLKENELGIPFDAISPDGRLFSYVDWETGDLAVFNRVTGVRRRLSDKGPWEKSAEMALDSVWSPDGLTVACVWINPPLRELWLFPLDGSKPKVLFSDPDLWVWDVKDWSRDGRKILVLFKQKEGEHEIGIIDVESGQSRRLKTLMKHRPVQMMFSPNGRFIVYDFQEDRTDSDIFIIYAEDGTEKKLIDHPAYDVLHGWSPDGKWILFCSDRAGKIDFWTLPVEGGEAVGPPVNIVEAPGSSLPMGFTADGAFYYTEMDPNRNIFRVDVNPASGTSTSAVRNLGKSYQGLNSQAVLSPNRNEVAYLSSRGPGLFLKKAICNTLCVQSLKTGQQIEIMTDLEIPNFNPLCWSLKGRAILFLARKSSKDSRRFSIYRLDIDRKVASEFYSGNPELDPELCSSDELFVIARQTDIKNHINRILRVDIETGNEEILYEGAVCPTYISLSPDNRMLVYVLSVQDSYGTRQRLHMITLEKREAQVLLEKKGQVKFYSTGWTSDSRSVLLAKIITTTKGQLFEIWKVPVDGGTPVKFDVDAVMPSFMNMDNRGLLIFSAGEAMEMNVWKMVNFLPKRKF